MEFGSSTLTRPYLGGLNRQRTARWTPRRRHDAQPPPWTCYSLLQVRPWPHSFKFETKVSSTFSLIRIGHGPAAPIPVSDRTTVLPTRFIPSFQIGGTGSKRESRHLDPVTLIADRVHREERLTGRLNGLAHHDMLHDLVETSVDRRITP